VANQTMSSAFRPNVRIRNSVLILDIEARWLCRRARSKLVDYARHLVSIREFASIIPVGRQERSADNMTCIPINIPHQHTVAPAQSQEDAPGCDLHRRSHAARQTIIHGDCLDAMRRMKAGSIDVVVTSPPYNIGVPYRSYDDRKPPEVYLRWMEEVAGQIARLLADDGALFLNIAAGPDPWIATDVAQAFRSHLTRQNRISWIKSIAIGDRTSGHFKPINSKRFLNRTHEEILHFTKRGDVEIDRLAIGVPYEDKTNLGRWQAARSDRRCAGNSWFIPYETVRARAGKHGHPAIFPVDLPLRCLQMHGETGTVLDPFAGSGTTLVAARMLGWNGIGIEIDDAYAEMARHRLAEIAGGSVSCC